MFKQPITELIKMRTSWRKYAATPIPQDLRQEIARSFPLFSRGPAGNTVEFQFVDKEVPGSQAEARLGTYGYIVGAKTFIVGKMKHDRQRLFEDYGYVMEQLILWLTDWGLSTCWLGGTYTRSQFGRAINLRQDEIIPAIAVVGYPTRQRSLRDRLVRQIAASKTRKPWTELFFSGDFSTPITPDQARPYDLPLEMVRLAPSASNKQPWRVLVTGNGCHFFIKRTPHYDRVIKGIDLQRIDTGIAQCHFELSAREAGLDGSWAVVPGAIPPVPGLEYNVSWLF